MKFNKIFKSIREEFPEEIALMVIEMAAIHMTQFPSDQDFEDGGKNYRERLESTFRDVLWEEDQEDFDVALKLWELLYDWEIRQEMYGLGDCEKKTFKELLRDKEI